MNNKIDSVIEQLAKNQHDAWARRRLADGWTYGHARDDVRKQHPSLVPYEELPESEKEYDRGAVLQTIKSLLAFGYKIEEPDAALGNTHSGDNRGGDTQIGDTQRSSPAENASAQRDSFVLHNIGTSDLHALLRWWQERPPEGWPQSPGVYQQVGERMLTLGEPLLAYDVLAEGLTTFPGEMRLQQLLALSLARSGATRQANEMLVHIQSTGESSDETCGLLARTFKDLAFQEVDAAKRKERLTHAQQVYQQAYRQWGGYWNGINAATVSLLLGQQEQAAAMAVEIRQLCVNALKKITKEGDRYWPLATLGEAALIQRKWPEAEDWYQQAAAVGQRRFGDLSSTRRNARLLLEYLGRDRRWIEQCLRIPRVAVFTGHMIDQPGRRAPRFPLQLEGAVLQAIRDRLKTLNVGFGYASAASGSDILFLEALLESGGEVRVVLPYESKMFLRDSVEAIPGSNWGDRFQSVLQQAREVVTVSGQRLSGGSISYEYANDILLGLAITRSEQLETELVPLAVWDGKAGDGLGGTANAISRWESLGYKVELIPLNEILQNQCPEMIHIGAESPSAPQVPEAKPSDEYVPRIMGIFFADAAGFSKLTEEQTPRFVQYFLQMVGEMARTSRHKPVMKNTWGDGLYFIFERVIDAGEFALELCDAVKNARWENTGLPQLSVRIGLHAGPVYRIIDPVTGQPNYIGTHVSQAARIEPITPPNQVYASQAFAALASADPHKTFKCEYVGQTPMAKGYGTLPTYVVRRLSV